MRSLLVIALLATPALAKRRPPDDAALSPDQIASTMRSRQPAFNACFRRALKANPNVTGRFVYAITIEATGRVSRAAPTAGTPESAPVDGCIVAAIKKIVFPKSSGRATITYPFVSST